MAPSPRSQDIFAFDHLHNRPRFPSFTEFPDSPSVYSHAYNSPDLDVHSGPAPFSCLSDSPDCPEFDYETASAIHSLATGDIRDDPDVDEFTDDASYRISLQGPKIRFHSRAPWETDSEESSNSAAFGNKLRGKTSRADHLFRTFTRGSSITSRPSVDSARSHTSATSFEITAPNCSSSHRTLYDLVRQSTSTASLPSSSTSVCPQNLALGTNPPKPSHHLTQTHDPLSRSTVSLDGTVLRAIAFESAPIPPSCTDVPPVGHECIVIPSLASLSQERQSRDQFIHPYANPDLVNSAASFPEMVPSSHPVLCGSDSNSTVTDSASTKSAAFSAISIETSTALLTSRDIPNGNLRLNGKEISSPISLLPQSDSGYVDRSTRFLSLHPPPAGFEGPLRNPRLPAVTLITLQEAQERERLRSNPVHSAAARSKLPFPSSDHIAEVAEDRIVEMDRNAAHTRARSTSSGIRHKAVPLPPFQHENPETRDESSALTLVGATPSRTLKHKKSGFMRLFGGRNSEGEKERSTPPPNPPPVDVYTEESSQTYEVGKTSKPALSMAPKSSSPTIPGSCTNNTTLASIHSTSFGGNTVDEKSSSSRRRQPPPLSIVTKGSDHRIPTSLSRERLSMGSNFPPAPFSLTVPQSAPPGNSDFSGLKLRPVSSFSSHFADMVTGAVGELQHDVHTPSSAASSNTALSPVTPISARRSGDVSGTGAKAPREGYLTVKGLQEQLVSAKQAWQQQIWELRGRIRDLTSELEDLRAVDNREYCEVCGRGEPRKYISPLDEKIGVVNRPRACTGDTGRFASGN